MVARAWMSDPPETARISLQSRSGQGAECTWSPLQGPDALLRWIDRHGPVDAMLVLAGVTPGPGAKLDQNTPLAEACLRGAKVAGIPKVLLASTSAVYGADSTAPYSETDLPRPVNAYGHAKLLMENACTSFKDAGLNITCLRIGNVAGADALLINAALANRDSPVQIDQFSDGMGPIRSYVGPATLARTLISLVKKSGDLPEVLNLAAPQPVSMQALAEASGAPWQFRPAPSTAYQFITMNCSAVAALHSFAANDSDPVEIVSQSHLRKRVP